MQFNSDKFEMLRYNANPAQPIPPQTLLSDDGSPIEIKTSLRDLGVTMTDDAKFTKHIQERVSVANKLIGWALRVFHTRALPAMMTIWKSLILCHLDYCSQLWSPSKTGEIQMLEATQRTFLKKIPQLGGMSYWEQLKFCKLFSLERRRERYSIIYTWRIIESQVPNLESTPITARSHIRRGRMPSPTSLKYLSDVDTGSQSKLLCNSRTAALQYAAIFYSKPHQLQTGNF